MMRQRRPPPSGRERRNVALGIGYAIIAILLAAAAAFAGATSTSTAAAGEEKIEAVVDPDGTTTLPSSSSSSTSSGADAPHRQPRQQLQPLDVTSPSDGLEVRDGLVPVHVSLHEGAAIAAHRDLLGGDDASASGLRVCTRWAVDRGCDALRADEADGGARRAAIARRILDSDDGARRECARPPMRGEVMFTANCWVMEFVAAVVPGEGRQFPALQTEYRTVNVATVDAHVLESYPGLKQTAGGLVGLLRQATRIVHKNRNPAALGGMGVAPLVMEFGSGQTTLLLNELIGREWKESVAIHTFDSFVGLPDKWRDGFDRGAFSLGGAIPGAITNLANVAAHRGWFNETLPALLDQTTDPALSAAPVSLLVLDVCLEESFEFVLEQLVCRLTEGSVLAFGSYFNFVGWNKTNGGYTAWASIVEKYGIQFRPVGFHATFFLLEVLQQPRKCVKHACMSLKAQCTATRNTVMKKWGTEKLRNARISNDDSVLTKELEDLVAVDHFNAEALGTLAFALEDIGKIADRLEYARRALVLQHHVPQENSGPKELLASLLKAPMKRTEVFARRLPLHRLRHDLEQLRYLKELERLPSDLVDRAIYAYAEVFADFTSLSLGLSDFVTLSWSQWGKIGPYFNRALYLPPVSRVAPTALSQAVDFSHVISEYEEKAVVVVDNFLSQGALEGLLRYYREATVFYDFVHPSYLGSYLVDGLGNPLLAQVIEEVSVSLRPILCDRPLVQAWVYKYDEMMERGIKIHADVAAVNFNIWLGENSDVDPDHSGGLVIYTQKPPAEWGYSMFNSEPTKPEVIDMLEKSSYRNVTVPHLQNRMVMFDSSLFHASDVGKWKPGYKSRRINLTLLFGRMRSTCD